MTAGGSGVRGGSAHPSLGLDGELVSRLTRLTRPSSPRSPLDAGAESDPYGSGSADVFSRIVWARLVEPGDAVAGALLARLGAARALELLIGDEREEALRAASAAASAAGTSGTSDAFEDGGAFDAAQLAKAFRRWRPRLDRAASMRDLEAAEAAGMRVVAPGTGFWPEPLDDLGPHAPILLWVRGDTALLAGPSVAVVGARACTGYGTHVTAELSESLCSAGAAIVSGAAYGVDAVAHRTALALDAPTVAVLAGGADRPYPSSHGPLLERIAETGAVCSEMVPGAAPTRWRFLQRNRLISALARAVLVTEAGVRSGSLNTAGHACSLGRELGAVPGPVTSAASAGCHQLIREYGAAVITNGAEARELAGLHRDPVLFDEAGIDAATGGGVGGTAASARSGGGGSASTPAASTRQPSLHRRVLDALPLRGARDAAEIARLSGVDLREARRALAELELLGSVARRETPDRAESSWRLLRRE